MIRLKKLTKFVVASSVLFGGYTLYNSRDQFFRSEPATRGFPGAREKFVSIAKREDQLRKLKSEEFDVLIIGGGATGSGAALDATTRGLKVALIERDDFASGTSSRSTKLIHGGVRYLEKAVTNFDSKSLMLVFDALHERSNFFNNAPFLCNPLPIMTPLYKIWEVPYIWIGLKLYDMLAGRDKISWSKYLSVEESLKEFPMLTKYGLKGSVIYYDGQLNDARMNVCLALTAAQKGAVVANHTEVTSILKNEQGKVNGVTIKDEFTGEESKINAKVVINCTGPFSDSIRKLDDPTLPDIINPSSGVHIILPDYYSPKNTGLIVPKTKDGRVIFMLPWLGLTIAGTTDSSTKITRFPHPHEDEITFILEALSDYLSVKTRREDVMAAWSGIRPLAVDTSAKEESTSSLSRDHLLLVSPSNLITIAGGKWTTYRKMAEDTIDKAVEVGQFKTKPCQTQKTKIIGAENWEPAFFTVITQDYKRKRKKKSNQTSTNTPPSSIDQSSDEMIMSPIPTDIAEHLSNSYGTRALRVAQIASGKYGNRLHDSFPYLEAEVIFAAEEEMACTTVDVIARRLRLAFQDTEACAECLPRVVDLMGEVLNWDEERKLKEVQDAHHFLHIMTVGRTDLDLSKNEPEYMDA